MTRKLGRYILWIIAALVTIYVVTTAVVDATKVIRWRHTGSINTNVAVAPGSTGIFIINRVDPIDFVKGRTPEAGDTLLTINDSIVTPKLLESFPARLPALYTATYLHHGVVETTAVQTRSVSSLQYWLIALMLLFRTIFVFAFIGVAIWAFRFRAASEGVQVLFAFCLAMAMYMTYAFNVLPNSLAGFTVPFPIFQRILFILLVTYLETFWLHLQLVFPRKHPFLQRKPALKYILLYSFQTVSMALAYIPSLKALTVVQLYINLVFVLQVGLGLWLLFSNYRNSPAGLERRQLKLVLLGSAIGFIPLTAVLTMLAYERLNWYFMSIEFRLILYNIAFLALLFMPITYAYAMGKYRLLDVEGKVRRGTRYFLVTVLLACIVFSLVYGVSEILLRTSNIQNRTPTLLIAILLTLGVTPTQRRVQQWLDSRFYPERTRLRERFTEFMQHLASLPDRETLWKELRGKLQEELLVEHTVPVLRQKEVDGIAVRSKGRAPFEAESQLVAHLQRENKPILIDELTGSKRVKLLPEEREFITKQQIALILPLSTRTKLIGFLGLGYKTDQQDFTPHDLTLLGSLGQQIAMAHENLQLMEENLVKQRMETELSVARKIQQRFLPESLPVTPGLDISATNRFCVEVAGDYYDIFNCCGDRTALAIGDVVGKGAGAALLMANLQASFRTAMESDSPLNRLIYRINNHICRSTEPEQYITFFAALYDPASHCLSYVNAGHNYPFVVKRDGTVDKLVTGGLLLGSFPDQSYELGEYTLAEGDVLVMYTDGVTEAMNEKGVEFGESRLADNAIREQTNKPQRIAEAIHHAVIEHHGSDKFEDDYTLVVAKVL